MTISALGFEHTVTNVIIGRLNYQFNDSSGNILGHISFRIDPTNAANLQLPRVKESVELEDLINNSKYLGKVGSISHYTQVDHGGNFSQTINIVCGNSRVIP